MNFVTLDDTLTGLANCVAAHQENTYKFSGAPKVLYQAKAYYPKFYTSSNGSINYTSLHQEEEDDTYRYSEAARILHQTLVKFPESHAMWRGRQSDQKLLQNDDVSTYGMAVLLHTEDWYHWETKRHIGNKFSLLNAKQVLDPYIEPMRFNATIGNYPREPFFRPFELGFDLVELIAFLDRNEIKHDLTLQDETELPVEDDIAVSQYETASSFKKHIKSYSSEFEFSGQLIIPQKIDEWFIVIDDMTKNFYDLHERIPNKAEAWANLWGMLPDNTYKLTTGTDKGGEACLKMAGLTLSKNAFYKRWENYTFDRKTNSPNNDNKR